MSLTQPFYKKISLQLCLVVVFGLGLLWYISYKAFHLSFTHDEAYTYTHYVHQAFMDIISYKTPYTNNHILNTVLMKYSEVFFGSSELALRLPNILAFVIYSVFSVLLFYKYCPKLILPFYLLMVLNPYLLDFFALARGYGLSIGFLVMSLYYLCLYFTSKHNKHLILFNAGAFLAVLSNFSLLNYYVAALITYNVVLYAVSKIDSSNSSYHFFKQNKINIASVILTGAVLYEPLRRISKMSLLDFGGKNGFMEDTVSTAVYSFFYEMHVPDFYMLLLKTAFTITVVLSLGLIVLKFIKKKSLFFVRKSPNILVNVILPSIILMTILQHLLLGNDFYIQRFALFFYPLYILNFVFLLSHFYDSGFKKTIAISSVIVACLFIYNLKLNYNLIYYKDWKWDRDIKCMIQKLVIEHQKNPDKQIRLGINWLFEPDVNFYRYTWNLSWLNPAHRRGISQYDDYFYILDIDKEFESLSNKPVIYKDDVSGAVLIKNTH